MYLVDMGLLGKTSDDDHSLSTRFLDDLYEVALKTTSELVQHLITVDTILAYSPKADTVAVFAPVRPKTPNSFPFPRNFSNGSFLTAVRVRLDS